MKLPVIPVVVVMTVVVIAAFWVSGVLVRNAEVARAAEAARADSAVAEALALKRIADSIRAVREQRVDTFIVRRTNWDTLKTSDTVTVETIIRVADSTISACDTALNACIAETATIRPALAKALLADSLRKEAMRPRRLFGFIPIPRFKPCPTVSIIYAEDGRIHGGVGASACLTF